MVETDKLATGHAGAEGGKAVENGIDAEVLQKTKKILSDYDAQLQHLNKELEMVKEEFKEWEKASR
ncbi:Nucleoporin nup57 [Taxawa tesnikishii (nom. ined.)]|nr:Nucleoporin nup57 [Dothideales sp. JES 119]